MGHIVSQDDIPKCQMLQITTAVELSREKKNEMMRVANVMECGFHLFS